MKTAGIYIHIPFCENKCNYCDYYCLANQNSDIGIFIKMLHKEIERTAREHEENWLFDTIYFGGGSPTLLSSKSINDILHKLKNNFNTAANIEVTLEVNPGEIETKELSSFKEFGVNRLSIGFQSLHEDLLHTLSRTHTRNDCFKTFENARVAGFNNISIDMLYNIPVQSVENWLKDLNIVISLEPDHIATYPLTIEEDTVLSKQINLGEISPVPEEIEFKMFTQCTQLLTESGFTQYEVAHFSKMGKECRHNQHYWNLEPYLAFGPSAHGYDGKKRWWNVSSLDEYLNALSNNKNSVSGFETLSSSDRFNEAVIYGLRTRGGISTEILHKHKNHGLIEASVKRWEKYLDISSDAIRMKPGNYHLADEIVSEMLTSDC
jgi:oxygen-independent coproporphyrinogen-3 oxidase